VKGGVNKVPPAGKVKPGDKGHDLPGGRWRGKVNGVEGSTSRYDKTEGLSPSDRLTGKKRWIVENLMTRSTATFLAKCLQHIDEKGSMESSGSQLSCVLANTVRMCVCVWYASACTHMCNMACNLTTFECSELLPSTRSMMAVLTTNFEA
jgi:hypothetical protein